MLNNKNRRAAGLARSAATWLLLLGLVVPAWPGWAASAILQEARALGRTRALYPLDEELAMARAVRAYLRTIDSYSTYIGPEELDFLAGLDQPDYSGIGMEVIVDLKGRLYCVPYEGGPAHRAGIRSGDRLLAVDGESVVDEPPEMLPTLVRGAAGTTVRMTVAGADGRERQILVARARVHRRPVESEPHGEALKIRIYRFEKDSPALVRQALQDAPDQRKIIVDLRGNIGGEVLAAVNTADLFLPGNKVIAKVEGRPDSDRAHYYHRSTSGGSKFEGRRVVIWQDQMTASASELFIAALVYNDAALSVGRKTFGKGLVQEEIRASDQGLFVITTGEIISPNGRPFHGLGIEPEPRLAISETGGEADYSKRTADAFSILDSGGQ